MSNMIKLVRTLTPENGMDFEDILSFETENYIGIWNYGEDRYVLIPRDSDYDPEFYLHTLDECNNLDELDNAVFKICDEHIIGVSENGAYRIVLKEE